MEYAQNLHPDHVKSIWISYFTSYTLSVRRSMVISDVVFHALVMDYSVKAKKVPPPPPCKEVCLVSEIGHSFDGLCVVLSSIR